LKNNGYRDLVLLTDENKREFEKKVRGMRDEYFCKNKDPKIPDNFEVKDELYIADKFIEKAEKENKKYLKNNDKTCFSAIKFIHYNNKYKYIEFPKDDLNKTEQIIIIHKDNIKTPSSMFLTSKDNNFLPELIRPESDLTLEKLINFYNEAIKFTRILPIFIRNVLKNNDEENKKKAEKCFCLLINTYKAFKPDRKSLYKDTSFLNYYVNEFIFSFERMISKFKKAGFNIYGLDFGSLESEENANEILKIPEFENLDEKANFWNIFKKRDFNELNKPFYDNNVFNKILNDNKDILKTNDYDTNLYNDKVEIIKKEATTQTVNKTPSPSVNINLPEKEMPSSMKKPIIINSNNNLNNSNINNKDNEFNAFAPEQEKFDMNSFIKIITSQCFG